MKNGIKSLEKNIALHKDKIANPRKHYPEWDNYDTGRQSAFIKGWEREISRYSKQVSDRKEELKQRGETVD